MLRALLGYERAANGLNFSRSYLGGLLLGRTSVVRPWIAAKKYPEAEIEFRKILENRGLVGLDPIGSLTRLQTGENPCSRGRDGEGEGCL